MSCCTLQGITSTKAARLRQLGRDDAPDPCIHCTPAEDRCNALVEKFRADFIQTYPHLKDRLLLSPVNEYGLEKFVCTYIQPTLLPYPELYDLKACSSFVANYVQYEPLGTSSTDSIALVSPAQTLASAVGDCFDCSFLLASLLIGAGYDTHVVFGTAPDWIRLKDQSHFTVSQCCEEDNDAVIGPRRAEMLVEDTGYAKKSSRGEGLHCWLLVKAGKRDIGESCFVEPSTGAVYPCNNSPYCRVYSVCNDKNCWINVGDDAIGEESLELVGDGWVPVLPNEHSAPYSWVEPLSLSKERFQLRYPPDGKRTINLHKTKVELFGDKVDPQGLISRVLRYEDTEQLLVLECTETYSPTQRGDHLVRRMRRPIDNAYHEYFSESSNMIERAETPGTRCVKFREKARTDGLVERREEIGSSIAEHFLRRSDGLVRREICLSAEPSEKDARKPPKSELLPLCNGLGFAAVESIDEHYAMPADKSDLGRAVASRSYHLKERSIGVAYHSENEVLRKHDTFHKDDLAKGSPREKELLSLENASLSAVKRTQTEMITLSDTKHQHEVSTLDPETSHRPDEEIKSSDMSSTSTKDEAQGAPIDYLSPYLLDKQGQLSMDDVIRVKEACLRDTKQRILERGKIIQSKLDCERQRLSEEQYQEGIDNANEDVRFRVELLEKRLAEHEERSIAKYHALEKKLDEDARFLVAP